MGILRAHTGAIGCIGFKYMYINLTKHSLAKVNPPRTYRHTDSRPCLADGVVLIPCLAEGVCPSADLADGARRPGNTFSRAAVGSWEGGKVMVTSWLEAGGRWGRRVQDGSCRVIVRMKSFATGWGSK